MSVDALFELILCIYRPTFSEYGLWDQIRVDHGLEWILSLYIQETLAHLRTDTSRAPHLQSSSKQVFMP